MENHVDSTRNNHAVFGYFSEVSIREIRVEIFQPFVSFDGGYASSFAIMKSSMTKPPPMSVITDSAMAKPFRW